MAYNKHGPVHQGRKGQYVGTHWHDDIEVIPDDERTMPLTIPHEAIEDHRYGCQCWACNAYPADLKREIRLSARRRR